MFFSINSGFLHIFCYKLHSDFGVQFFCTYENYGYVPGRKAPGEDEGEGTGVSY